MTNLNKCIVQGNLVDDPKIFGTDQNVARSTLAVNNGYGERTSTTFVDCVAFGKQVAVIQKSLQKGKQVVVEGKLMTVRWEDKESQQKRSKLEIQLEQFGGFYFTSGGGGSGQSETAEVPAAHEEEKLF